jgi:hypothetical protein
VASKGLIIDQPWIGKILKGEKIWEMRSRSTNVRGEIALIAKGTGTIVGFARLVDSLSSLSADEMQVHFSKHRIPAKRVSEPGFRWFTPWVLADVRCMERPIPYQHPSGAVTWVNLDPTSKVAPASTATSRATAVAQKPADVRPEPTGSFEGIRIPLTGGNIRNGHFYLRAAQHLIPRDAIGGSNRSSPGRPITVRFSTGELAETDVDGEKMIFRARGPVRSFINQAGAREGDEVLIRRQGDRDFHVSLARPNR